ncbi:MAG TPA: ribonuclease E/G, partial [Blastococcus sp.]|nr:ribonuclease E/G [Blastococcus sp.]
MAENENENTDITADDAAGAPEAAVDETVTAPTPSAEDEDTTAAEGDTPGDTPGDQAVADEPLVDAEALAAAPEPQPQPEHEPELPRFATAFSSPEPTAVVARPRRRATRSVIAADPDSVEAAAPATAVPAFVSFVAPPEDAPPAPRRRARRPVEAAEPAEPAEDAGSNAAEADTDTDTESGTSRSRRSRSRRRPAGQDVEGAGDDTQAAEATAEEAAEERDDTEDSDEGAGAASRRRRRGRRGRGRGRSGEDSADGDDTDETGDEQHVDAEDEDAEGGDESAENEADESGTGTRRRRRRRRRTGGASAEGNGDEGDDDRPERAGRNGRTTSDDDVRGVAGSTRLEAKRQRRRDGRDNGRRRTPILTESEFLARREAVDRKMVIRQRGERTQIAVLEDDVLVEHYVTQAQSTSFAGNVYLGRVQNVLPSMEAAFVDIGKGRNAVLYAGEVNWDAAGLSGKSRSIETALKSGDKVLVQVTKDPIGHKGARLTQQINLPGRFLVYVPGGSMTGISRKLPDTERQRLKDILKRIVPEDAGVIIRTAAEGASEEELTR